MTRALSFILLWSLLLACGAQANGPRKQDSEKSKPTPEVDLEFEEDDEELEEEVSAIDDGEISPERAKALALKNQKELSEQFGVPPERVAAKQKQVKKRFTKLWGVFSKEVDSKEPERRKKALMAAATYAALGNKEFARTRQEREGSHIPKAFFKARSAWTNGVKRHHLVSNAGFLGISPERHAEQLFLLEVASLTGKDMMKHLMSFVRARAKSQPTAGDAVLYHGLFMGLGENRAYSPVHEKQKSKLRIDGELHLLATVKNPIYRYLAVQLCESVYQKKLDRLRFYGEFSGETDATIRAEVTERLGTMRSAAANQLLNRLRRSWKKLDG